MWSIYGMGGDGGMEAMAGSIGCQGCANETGGGAGRRWGRHGRRGGNDKVGGAAERRVREDSAGFVRYRTVDHRPAPISI
jgi:hypothetical protein